jgi:hypothetical protein
MAEINVSTGSWLNLTELLEFRGIVFWGNTDYPEIPFSEDDTYIRLTQQQAKQIDLVAFDYLGDPELYWIICLANNKDMVNAFLENELIRIPPLRVVEQILTPIE